MEALTCADTSPFGGTALSFLTRRQPRRIRVGMSHTVQVRWLAILLGLPVLFRPALAELSCSSPNANGLQLCVAGLRSDIATTLYAVQSMNQWCWAASIAMVFKHHGFEVPQEEIVAQAWGNIVNMPGQPQQILASLNRVWMDTRGRRFQVSGDVYTANPPNAAQDLAANNPLIIGTQGHAMVLTALQYMRAPNGNGTVTLATVRDPWPGRGRRDLRADEWYQTMLLVRIRVTPQTDRGEGGRTSPCVHRLHPKGDATACIHRLHPQGDVTPCRHACPGPYGPVPCHSMGDIIPCQHLGHPGGDLSPCQHPLHPAGDPSPRKPR